MLVKQKSKVINSFTKTTDSYFEVINQNPSSQKIL